MRRETWMPLSSLALGTSTIGRTLSVRLLPRQAAETGVFGIGSSDIEAACQAARLQDSRPPPATRPDPVQRRWRLWMWALLELWGPAACLAGANLLDDGPAPRIVSDVAKATIASRGRE